jgi:hypothetical protein
LKKLGVTASIFTNLYTKTSLDENLGNEILQATILRNTQEIPQRAYGSFKELRSRKYTNVARIKRKQ